MNRGFRNLRRRDFLKLASLAGLGLAIPIARAAGTVTSQKQGFQQSVDALGTVVTIRVDDPLESEAAGAIVADSFGEVSRLEAILSRFVARSPVTTLNMGAYIVKPDPELVQVLKLAAHNSDLTEGAYDVTVLPALNLFKDVAAGGSLPTDAQFDGAKALIDFEKLNVSDGEVSFSASGMGMTLDCIGKGWILDRIHDRLKTKGVRSALVQGGGSFRAVGAKADGSPWAIGVRDPLDANATISTVYLKDNAVITSGDYENYFTADKKYYHIIDPATARSPLFSHSATITAPIAAQADPLGVSSMVKSPQEALSMIESTKDCECLIATRDAGNVKSSGFGGSQ
jgi:thiamine biosynthesis lipoprotein